MTTETKTDWRAANRARNLAEARKLVETATAYLAALERADGDYTRFAMRAEVPLLEAIYNVTECADVWNLLADLEADLEPNDWCGDDERRLEDAA